MTFKLVGCIFSFVLFAAWDSVGRLHISSDISDEQLFSDAPEVYLPVRLSEQQKAEIIKLYRAYDLDEYITNKQRVKGMTDEQQSKQYGVLDQLFSGDMRIRLSAVINQPEQSIFSLVTVENIRNDKTDLEKLKLGQLFYGYQIIGINLNSVQFRSVDEPSRTVTLPIYRISGANKNDKEQ